jgi:hypothetical protein
VLNPNRLRIGGKNCVALVGCSAPCRKDDCRVIGCTGLRVIDASIMPEVPRANTHLTTVAIAERMADRLKAAG